MHRSSEESRKQMGGVAACLQPTATADGCGNHFHDHNLDEKARGVRPIAGKNVVHVVKALQSAGRRG